MYYVYMYTHTHTHLSGFPGGASGKEPTCQCRRHRKCELNPWVGKIPFRRDGNPFQYSCLENPMDRIAWWAMVHRVSRSQTQLKWLSIYIHTYSRAWNIPWTEEPGEVQSMGSHSIRHDLVTEQVLIYKKLPVSYMCVSESLCYKAEINLVDLLYLNKIKSLYIWKWNSSVVSNSLWPPWTIAYQAPPSMEFFRLGYWSGLPFPSVYIHKDKYEHRPINTDMNI